MHWTILENKVLKPKAESTEYQKIKVVINMLISYVNKQRVSIVGSNYI